MLEKLIMSIEKIKKKFVPILFLVNLSFLTGCFDYLIKNPAEQFIMPKETQVVTALPLRNFVLQENWDYPEEEGNALYLIDLEKIEKSRRLCFIDGIIANFSLCPAGDEIAYTQVESKEDGRIRININSINLKTRKRKTIDTLETEYSIGVTFSKWLDADTLIYGYIRDALDEEEEYTTSREVLVLGYETKKDKINEIVHKKIEENGTFIINFPVLRKDTFYFLSFPDEEGKIRPQINAINLGNRTETKIYLPSEIIETCYSDYIDFDISNGNIALTTEGNLWVINKNEKQRLQMNSILRYPVWSPSGEKLAFSEWSAEGINFVSHIYVYYPQKKGMKSVFALPPMTNVFFEYEWINDDLLWIAYVNEDMFVQSKIPVEEPLANKKVVVVPMSYIALSKLYSDTVKSYRTNKDILEDSLEWCEELNKPHILTIQQWANLLRLYGYENDRPKISWRAYK